MASSLARAALALLCCGAVIFGTALFPAALDVELRSSEPASGPSQVQTPTATATPSNSGGSGSTATATATPTPTATPVPPDDAGGGDGLVSVVRWLVGLVAVGGLGYVGLRVARSLDGAGGFALAASLPSVSWGPLPAIAARVAGLVQFVPQTTTAVLLAGSAGLARVAKGIGTLVGGVLGGLSTGAGPLGRMAARSVGALPTVVGTVVAAPIGALGAFGSGGGLLASLRGDLATPSVLESEDPTTDDARAATDVPAADDSESDPTIREAWAAMVALVPVSNPEATTPGEYARRAIDRGLPAGPVRRLTEIVRRVEYGDEPATATLTEAARDALDSIQRGGEDQ